MKLTREQLLGMSNEKIKALTLGKNVLIMTNHEEVSITVGNIQTTPHAPDGTPSFTGFISAEGKTILLQRIVQITIM